VTAAPSPYPPARDAYDEAFAPDGSLRPEGGVGVSAIGDADLEELCRALGRALGDQGVGFRSVNGETEFNVDPIPRVLGAGEWEALEAGLVQRVKALNAFVADVYGPRRAIAEGVVPARVVENSEGYESRVRGVRPPGDLWIGVAGLDLVRDASGELLVLEDNATTPSGFAYALAARAALMELLDVADGVAPRPLDDMPRMLMDTLRSAAPDAADPYVVVLTDGPDNSAYYEHAWAAGALGVTLAEPRDLELRGDRLLHGDRPVDVVYRRTNADVVDTDIGALLVPALRAGTLAVVNAFGTRVADDKLAHAYVEDMVRFYLGEEPLLRSVETLDLCDDDVRERALDELESLVVKPRNGSGGVGVVICAHARPEDVDAVRREISERPHAYVAQPRVEISLHPTVIGDELLPRHVDLRPFVFLRGDGEAAVMPGGLTRVAFDEGAMVVNSTQNGGAKDTWVLP
jgi:uncharacterized circularly permuted ATP-grasp superfamily protein